jgi:profilin
MSWQAYVDTNLVGTGKILKAAIYGHNGQLWATSAGFNVSNLTKITDQEITTLVGSFTDASKIRQSGIFIAGDKYFALRADDRSVYGKKVLDCNVGGWWRSNRQDQTSSLDRSL